MIAQCPTEHSELLNDYAAEPDRIALIPGAVDLCTFYPVDRAQARQHIGLSQDGYVIVYVGRLLPRKDIRNIVRAMGRLLKQYEVEDKPITLLIVGGETEDADPYKTPETGLA